MSNAGTQFPQLPIPAAIKEELDSKIERLQVIGAFRPKEATTEAGYHRVFDNDLLSLTTSQKSAHKWVKVLTIALKQQHSSQSMTLQIASRYYVGTIKCILSVSDNADQSQRFYNDSRILVSAEGIFNNINISDITRGFEVRIIEQGPAHSGIFDIFIRINSWDHKVNVFIESLTGSYYPHNRDIIYHTNDFGYSSNTAEGDPIINPTALAGASYEYASALGYNCTNHVLETEWMPLNLVNGWTNLSNDISSIRRLSDGGIALHLAANGSTQISSIICSLPTGYYDRASELKFTNGLITRTGLIIGNTNSDIFFDSVFYPNAARD